MPGRSVTLSLFVLSARGKITFTLVRALQNVSFFFFISCRPLPIPSICVSGRQADRQAGEIAFQLSLGLS